MFMFDKTGLHIKGFIGSVPYSMFIDTRARFQYSGLIQKKKGFVIYCTNYYIPNCNQRCPTAMHRKLDAVIKGEYRNFQYGINVFSDILQENNFTMNLKYTKRGENLALSSHKEELQSYSLLTRQQIMIFAQGVYMIMYRKFYF